MKETVPEKKLGPIRRFLLLRFLAGQLPRPLARAFHRRVGRDPILHAAYEAMRLAEKNPERRELSPGQVEAIASGVVWEGESAASGRLYWPATAGATALIGAMVLAFVVLPGGGSKETDWQARGGIDERVGLRLRCLSTSSNGDAHLIHDVATMPGVAVPNLQCADGDLLAFSASNFSEKTRYIFAVGITRDHQIRWLVPFEASAPFLSVKPNEIDRLLDTLADLNAFPKGEDLAIHVFFSPSNRQGSEVAEVLENARRNGVPIGSLERLPFSGVDQTRVLLNRKKTRGETP
jgi:hypothetical protein